MEADEPKRSNGEAPTPRRETVEKVALALEVSIDEALRVAGYASEYLPGSYRRSTRVGPDLTGPAHGADIIEELDLDRPDYDFMNDDALPDDAKERIARNLEAQIRIEREMARREREARGEGKLPPEDTE